MPLWACIGLALAMLLAVTEATATARGNPEGATSIARSTSPRATSTEVDGDDHLRRSAEPGFRRSAREPSSVLEVASEPEDHDAFETPRGASTPAPVPIDVLDPPASAPFVDTGRPSVSTGLGRGPPPQR